MMTRRSDRWRCRCEETVRVGGGSAQANVATSVVDISWPVGLSMGNLWMPPPPGLCCRMIPKHQSHQRGSHRH